MSGHSKWSSIKHKKAVVDAKRGKIFTKIIREITVTARIGGGDLASNARLRRVVEDAKAVNMPQDNVKKAILRGTGELPGVSYEELVYEGYGPSGVAVVVEVTTDNRNRSSSEVRSTFSKYGGNMGEAGSVLWMFDKRGVIEVEKKSINEDELITIALDAGALDVEVVEETFEIITNPNDIDNVKDFLMKKNVKAFTSEVVMIPKITIKLSEIETEKVNKLVEMLEDNDDVQNVYTNKE